jgi:hypothetical protein
VPNDTRYPLWREDRVSKSPSETSIPRSDKNKLKAHLRVSKLPVLVLGQLCVVSFRASHYPSNGLNVDWGVGCEGSEDVQVVCLACVKPPASGRRASPIENAMTPCVDHSPRESYLFNVDDNEFCNILSVSVQESYEPKRMPLTFTRELEVGLPQSYVELNLELNVP